MVTLKELENGNLQIILTDKEDLENLVGKEFDNNLLSTILDNARYMGNDWHIPYSIGLTEAPAIGYGAIYNDTENDNTEAEDYEKIWYYAEYMIKDLGEQLLNNGSVELVAIHQVNPTQTTTVVLNRILKSEYDEYYKLIIEVNSMTFESQAIWNAPQIAKKFGIPLYDVLKLIDYLGN